MGAGTSAPPMIDMTSKAEPTFVYTPRFFTLSAKIVGNMIESKKPSSTKAHTETAPDPAIAVQVHRKAQTAKNPNNLGGAIRFMIADPPKHPIMNPITCHFKKLAPTLSGLPGNRC